MIQLPVLHRVLSITAIATAFLAILVAVSNYGWKEVYQRRFLRKLQDLDIPFSRPHQLTYLSPLNSTDSTYADIAYTSSRDVTEIADTTAVILNWSRLENVLLISTLLCSPYLHDIISQVIVWNNNPSPLKAEVRVACKRLWLLMKLPYRPDVRRHQLQPCKTQDT